MLLVLQFQHLVSDIRNIIDHYSWDNQLLQEVQNVIYNNFTNIGSALEYFIKTKDAEPSVIKSARITKENFEKSINSLLPNRFSAKEIQQVWSQVSRNQEVLSPEAFTEFLSDNRFKAETSSLKQVFPNSYFLILLFRSPRGQKLNTSTQKNLIDSLHEQALKYRSVDTGTRPIKIAKPEASDATFEHLKQIIRSSSSGIYELFKEADPSGIGKVSPKEFKSVINKLNVGLSNYEVDLLLDYCKTFPDGYIDWMSFVDRIRFK